MPVFVVVILFVMLLAILLLGGFAADSRGIEWRILKFTLYTVVAVVVVGLILFIVSG